ncbi:phage holin family protein [Flammeovirga pacifica]|uniref:Phage holin family protein n=1 Tax=Flammeovirga pacifica TaxID=915059 RepID=A0A1S1YSM4_FLAPC|nr:phage holin family protein [Flammeovirga pacifica]OHX64032.1 hypothetical protein NH26_20705 [Flammeovirga pacifica]
MKNFIISTLVASIAVWVCAGILEFFSSDISIISNYTDAIIAALVIGILNSFVKPILTIITIPITVFTLGIFLLVINGLMIYFAGYLLDGFNISSFGIAFVFSLFYSTVLSLLNSIFDVKD